MSDAEARVLGSGTTIEVGGKVHRIEPLGMKELAELQREALKFYKRQYLKTFTENEDLLPDKRMLEKKFDEVARWDINDCPTQRAYDTSTAKITPALIDRLTEEYGPLFEDDDNENVKEMKAKVLLRLALDSEAISIEEVEKLSGDRVRSAKISYDTWWITSTFEGQTALITVAIRKTDPSFNSKDVLDWAAKDLAHVSNEVEKITRPAVGNT
jgi:hypothetical protein